MKILSWVVVSVFFSSALSGCAHNANTEEPGSTHVQAQGTTNTDSNGQVINGQVIDVKSPQSSSGQHPSGGNPGTTNAAKTISPLTQ